MFFCGKNTAFMKFFNGSYATNKVPDTKIVSRFPKITAKLLWHTISVAPTTM